MINLNYVIYVSMWLVIPRKLKPHRHIEHIGLTTDCGLRIYEYLSDLNNVQFVTFVARRRRAFVIRYIRYI